MRVLVAGASGVIGRRLVPLLGAVGHGPGSAYAADGSTTRQVQAGRMPIVGSGESVFSFTHADDAASAVVAALDRDVSGALNIVDDTPTPIKRWLPEFAAMLKAPAPKRVPAALAWLAVGGWGWRS